MARRTAVGGGGRLPRFAVDIPAGLAIAALAWVLGPLTVGVRRRPEPRPVRREEQVAAAR